MNQLKNAAQYQQALAYRARDDAGVEFYPLTHPQQRIYYTERLRPGTSMWNNAGTIKIRGYLDFELLEKAVLCYVRDNPSLRLRITERDGVPMQYISDEIPAKLDILDFSARGAAWLYEWDTMMSQSPTPMMDSKLYYFALVRLSDTEGGIYVRIHHLISDALSLVMLSSRIMENYQALIDSHPLPAPPVGGYIDHIREEQDYFHSKRFALDHQFWMDRFSDAPEPTALKPRKSNATKARRKACIVPYRISESVRSFCAAERLSEFSVFLAALSIYLNRVTGRDDIVISAPVYNRTSSSIRDVFGMFVSTVPVRIKIDDEMDVASFIRKVSSEWFSILKHQKYPYDMLLHELRKTHRGLDSLYDITLSFQHGKFEKASDRFSYSGRWHFAGHQATPFNIHINDRENDGRFIIDYDYLTPMFSAKEVDYLHTHLMNLLSDALSDPAKPLHALDMLSREERESILVRFNSTQKAYPKDNVLSMFRRFAAANPDKAALTCGRESLTYNELDRRSDALAQALIKKGIQRGSVVALWLPRSLDYALSALSVLKAGGAYLPIDATLPMERVHYMLADSGASLVLAAKQLLPLCPGSIPAFAPDEKLPEGDRPLPEVGASDIAYLIYTSGSTGKPKGVVVDHGALSNFMYALGDLWNFSAPDACVLCGGSISFDLSVMELWGALTHGARGALCPEAEQSVPDKFVSFLLEQGVNIMLLTPGRMELLLSDERAGICLSGFKEIAIGGDILTPALLSRIQALTPARIYNMYGPTETTVVATAKDVTRAQVVNIGRPIPNVQAYILDRRLNPVSINVPGELYIGGAGIARGYVNNPALNRERFVENPFRPGEQLYRTGDLARWYPLGEIEYLGRADAQVKIRGFRVELGEIENRLEQIEGIENAIVIDRTDANGRKSLAAYLLGEGFPPAAEIKAELSRYLPPYMIPATFTRIESVPLTHSGKVDRRLLPEPEECAAEKPFLPPQTPTEYALAELFRHELNIKAVGLDDDFFDLGGDSLTIVSLLTGIRQTLHADISLEEMYQLPTLRNIALLIDKARHSEYQPIQPANGSGIYPASTAQERMFVLAKNAPQSLAYHVPVALELGADADPERLRAALKALVERHSVLRTGLMLKDGELVQQVHLEVPFALQMLCCRNRSLTAVLKSLIRPMPMDEPPLMRATLIDTDTGRRILLIDLHHCICDGRSIGILLEELALLYSGCKLEPNRIDYPDYAVWQRAQLSDDALAGERKFWLDALSGELPMLNLRTDKPRGATQSFLGAQIRFSLDTRDIGRLRALARAHDLTAYMVLLGAYAATLYKHTGQEDMIIGTPALGRSRSELSTMVGMFVTTLPMRVRPIGEKSFLELLEQVKSMALGAFDHADYPLERLVRDLRLPRTPDRNPLFDTMLLYRTSARTLPTFGKRPALPLSFDPGSSKLDLSLEAEDSGDELAFLLEYDTSLFKRESMQRFAEHFRTLLSRLLDDPAAPISSVSALSEDEYRKLVYDFNDTARPIDLSRPVLARFEEQVLKTPGNTALITGGERMSYASLNARANKIAWRLRELGIGRGDLVALCMRRGFDLIAALFGILKSGAGYLPVDPDYPADRVQFMYEDSGVALLFTDGASPAPFSGRTFTLADIPETGREDNPPADEGQEDVAYVIFTSGSTGVPKGVMLPRRALNNLICYGNDVIGFKPGDVSASITTASFDIFIIDALLPLCYGATTVLCTEEQMRIPGLLAQVLDRCGVTFLQATPTRMQFLLTNRDFCKAAHRNLTAVACGGEFYPLALLHALKRKTRARIINAYGPTETTVYSSFFDVTKRSFLTVGPPMPNTTAYMLDANLSPVPIGVPGEIYIGGLCVGTCYINREALTREKFIDNPFHPGTVLYRSGDIGTYHVSGEIEILGRADFQIKLHGLRIELGEIEIQASRLPGVRECVAVALGEGNARYIALYYAADEPLEEAFLREQLGQTLPAYMIPARFVHLLKLPQTPNGKTDRRALPAPDATDTSRKGTRPKTPTERRMATIWKQVLGVPAVFREDDFFAKGGDSLGVIKVLAAISQYGWKMRTREFYEKKTLTAICAALEQSSEGPQLARSERAVPKLSAPNAPADLSNVLLTGATGFLGAHVLRSLARKGGKITCLVRAKDSVEANNRLRSALKHYFPDEADALAEKATAIAGDISDPALGGAEKAGTVIHCAALTAHVGRTEEFARVNVEGAKNIIAWCKRCGAELVHVSTVSVCGTGAFARPFTEADFDVSQQVDGNEYIRSKFLAEAEMFSALEAGMKISVMRVGNLCCRHSDGVFQMRPEHNAFYHRMRALAAFGLLPKTASELFVELTPVDVCADALVALLSGERYSAAYHILNPHRVTLGALAGAIAQKGRAIRTVDDSAFNKKLEQLRRRKQYEALAWLTDTLGAGAQVDCALTQRALEENAFAWPKPDAEYLDRYLSLVCQ
ncbi:MAG: amino acid adenylation domain-containing protein [Bacillota bacterium]